MIATSADDVVDKTFDFVIAGGGTAGLTLAARLSEDPSVTVVVLEAGENTIGDPAIAVPAQFGATLGNPKYDWASYTTKQSHSNDKEILWSRGKGLGGSSAVNFHAWSKPPASDVDALEKLGNPGWNWADYLKYSKKSETFIPPVKELTDLYPHTYDAEYRGTSGPIQVTIPAQIHTIDALFQKTLVNMGHKAIKDPYGGDITGTWIASANLDSKTWTRSYAATAYLLPYQNRPNLIVLPQALVARVLFADNVAGGELTATGIEFSHEGKIHVVHARKEVILSAGTVKSPQILELSGIGRPNILSDIGVDIKVQLPGVGENLQDHNFIAVSFELNPARHVTLDRLRTDPEFAKEALRLHGEGKGIYRTGVTSFAYFPLSLINSDGARALLGATEKQIQELKDMSGAVPGLQDQLDIQLATLRDETLPDMEVIAFPGLFSGTLTPEPGKNYVSLLAVLNHPLSRGTIHVKTKDPQDNPEIDPHCLERDTDLENLVQHFKYVRRMAETEPLKIDIVGPEVEPGPECQTDQQIREYIKDNLATAWHGIGACAMLPHEKHGVVDPQLKVYGTTNLRVVDISIIPLHIAAHTQATAYVIGEKAADLIRSAHTSNT
ncbi:Versicolorin B synthase [Hypsizygus marmoreus]|uniref:Versicolorin B synthase n=1 Tax=Hypsizygus marmoreus TaxID=39966 RepID=A0A369JP16_HYPMA|nr:Versicolorin B synthase [Hypsizygus marmoreus]